MVFPMFLTHSYLPVLNAGHMVPLDIPSVALDMIKAFVKGQNFNGFEQSIERDLIGDESCPVCPSCDASDTSAPSLPSENFNHSNVPLILGIVVACVGVIYWQSKKHRLMAARRTVNAAVDYDLELHNTGQYQDEWADNMQTI